MVKLRKYLVFWIIVLGVFVPFATPVGAWLRTTFAPISAAAAGPTTDSFDADATDDGVAGPDEEMALAIEHDFEMVDVVNIAHVGDGGGGVVFVIQMGIDRPVEDAVYEAILVKALQGLDNLKSGDESFYWVELLYGNWLVGRLECNAQPYAAQDISSDNCEYSDVNPAAYMGDLIRWPGRPADSPQSN